METRVLGRTGIRVSLMGMGCSNIGRALHGYSRSESLATLKESFESGIDFYDTAPGYTLGESERLIGEAFRSRRDQVVLASKVGVRRAGVTSIVKRFKHRLKPVAGLLRPVYRVFPRVYRAERRIDYSPEFVTASVEGSLRRLRTDYLDLLQLHYPTVESLEAGAFGESFERLKEQGKIRATGASVATLREAVACLERPDIDVVQLPLNLVDQEAIDDFLPRAAKQAVGVIARLAFAQGLLLGPARDTKADRWAPDGRVLAERRRFAARYFDLANESRSMAQASLLFLRGLEGISTCIPGYGSREHLHENLRAFALPPFGPQEMRELRARSRRVD